MNVIGHYFDDFQVLRQVAKGATSYVFLASDGNVVKAIKLFPPEHQSRASKEYQFGRHFNHPNVNAVEAKIEVSGFPGVKMPFVLGERLLLWLEHDGRTLPELLACFKAFLSGLAYLHDNSVIHRDIKPENIIVDRSGQPHIIDYDLAIYQNDDSSQQKVAGSVAYLSPEQARGERAQFQSDLYAAGIILYRALTGKMPFLGSVPEVLRAHRETMPAKPSHFYHWLEPLDPVVTGLLAKNLADRFAKAAEVLQALEDAEQHLVLEDLISQKVPWLQR